ncbi:MAG: HEAT repeat domain-containing protein [Candidatus Thorarchaeota archaeon]
MRKTDTHKKDLKDLLTDFLSTWDDIPITQYFIQNSNLPGRRGNLEMASAFVNIIEEEFTDHLDGIWNLSVGLTKMSSTEAPTNDPREMIPFCGTRALGSIGAISDDYFKKSIIILRELASDPRWRMREAVAAALGRILLQRGQLLIHELEHWINNSNWLEMRAVAAAVAHPSALGNNNIPQLALNLHKSIFQRINETRKRKSEKFKVLRKGLCYTLSVVTQAIPEEGFSYMKHLIGVNDPDINFIVRENLKKNRLKKNFPNEIASLNEILK